MQHIYPFPRTDLQDLSYSMRCLHLIHSAQIISRNYLLGGAEWKKKRADQRRNVIDLAFHFFYWLNFKVFSRILRNTKSSLEQLSSDLPVELKLIAMYCRNSFLKLDRKLSRGMCIGTFCRHCWKLVRCPLSLPHTLCYYESALESFDLLINLILRKET